MIEGLKPYASMKDSGVPWLGEVPEHWEIQRGKTLFRSVDVRSESGLEELLTVSSNHGVVPRRTASVTMFKAESYVGHKLCWPGDLVINSLWAWSRGLGVSRHHGIISTAYGVYRCRDTNALEPRFVDELVRSSPFHWELRVRSKGVWTSRLQLTDESFLGAPFPLPPLPEQAAIVRFLDHADRKIFRYIRAKQMLIKLLEEQKQVISHRAVTRGLNPNVRLKASGVEWLGDVPEHWDVTRVKNEFFCLNRRRIPLSATERGAMTLRRYDYFGASGAIDKVAEYLFDDDLLLIAEDGANLVLRNLPLAILARGKFWVNNHAHILKPKRGSLEYLAGVMECINYQPWISGAAQPKLTMDRLMSVTIAVAPPLKNRSRSSRSRTRKPDPCELQLSRPTVK
jgi:type I restriction enzyme, S subunit